MNEKIRVLELSNSKSARKIADQFGVGKTQIQNILKRKAEVLEDVENYVSGEKKREKYFLVYVVFANKYVHTIHL